MVARPETLPDRFWSKLDKTGDCWLWTAKIGRDGYGYIDNRGAHRVAFELTFGPIPSGKFVCHRCDNKLCARPKHLFLGDQFDNMRDMAAKGRSWQQKKTHCKNGHEFTPDNIYSWRGSRACRVCRDAVQSRRVSGRRAQA